MKFYKIIAFFSLGLSSLFSEEIVNDNNDNLTCPLDYNHTWFYTNANENLDKRTPSSDFFSNFDRCIHTEDGWFYEGPLLIPVNLLNLTSDEEILVETAFAQMLQKDLSLMIKKYNDLEGSFGGRVLDMDLARKLWCHDITEMARFVHATEIPAGLFVKYLYYSKITDIAKRKGPNGLIVFTSGGNGSGKSTVINAQNLPTIAQADIIFDGTMRRFDVYSKMISAALELGLKVEILHVYRPAEIAIEGVVTRAIKEGRACPLAGVARTHYFAQNNMFLYKEAFGNKINISVFHNKNKLTEGEYFEDGIAFLNNPEIIYESEESVYQKVLATYQSIDKSGLSPESRRIFEEGEDIGVNTTYEQEETRFYNYINRFVDFLYRMFFPPKTAPSNTETIINDSCPVEIQNNSTVLVKKPTKPTIIVPSELLNNNVTSYILSCIKFNDEWRYAGKLGIPVGRTLNDDEAIQESIFAAQLELNLETAVDAYKKLEDSHGGRIVDTDIARKLYEPYAFPESPLGRLQLACPTLNVAAYFVDYFYHRSLAEIAFKMQEKAENNNNCNAKVIMLAGGDGSGKTSSIQFLGLPLLDQADLIKDSTLSDTFEHHKAMIAKTLTMGIDVNIVYVFRPIELAVISNIERVKVVGRVRPLKEIAFAHYQSQQNVIKLKEYFKDLVDIIVIDNSGKLNEIKLIPKGTEIDFLTHPDIAYADSDTVYKRALATYNDYDKQCLNPEIKKLLERSINPEELTIKTPEAEKRFWIQTLKNLIQNVISKLGFY